MPQLVVNRNILSIKVEDLFYLFMYSFIFKSICFFFSVITLYTGLCTSEQTSFIIIGFIICYIGYNLVGKYNENYKTAVKYIVNLIFKLLVLCLLWYIIGSLLPLASVYGACFLDDYFILMGEGNSSSGEPAGGGSSGQPSSSGSGGQPSGGQPSGGGEGEAPKPNKPSKPNLQVKTAPDTDQDKELAKMTHCEHTNMGSFQMNTQEEVDATLCDFGATKGPNGEMVPHTALDSVTDHALLCNDCLAIICKDCCEDYSDDEAN